MSARKPVKPRQRKAILLPDIHHYMLLVAGEMFKLDGHDRLLRLAVKCGSTVLSRTVPSSGPPCRAIVPIAHLAIGHAHYLQNDMEQAVDNLQAARLQFQTLPDSPVKQLYFGRCVVLLMLSRTLAGRQDPGADALSDAAGLLRGLMNSKKIDQPRGRRSFRDRADNALLKLAHPPGAWYERCLYDIVEITTTYLHGNRNPGSDTHYQQLVALLLDMPAKGAPKLYETEREFALSLTFHSKMNEALSLWRRLLHWKNRKLEDNEEQDDSIRFRVVTCLVTLGRTHEAKEELSKMDLAYSLIHFSHGPGLLYLARHTYYQSGDFDKLLELCRGYQDLCDRKYETNDIVPLMNRYYSARILKKLGKYDEAVERYRAFVYIVGTATELMSGDTVAQEIDSTRTLQGLLGEGRRGLAHALRLSGHIDECIFEYRKALQSLRTRSFSDLKVVRAVLKSLAYLYESTGDAGNAIVAYDLLHRHYLRKPARDPMAAIKYGWYRGKMFLLMGQLEHALALFRQAHATCAVKRMENSKTRWPTPAELELARKTIEGEDEEQDEETPRPKEEDMQSDGQEAAAQSKRQSLGEEEEPSRGGEIPGEHTSTGPSQDPAQEDLDVEDRSPFGPQVFVTKLTVSDNDRWWARTIEASMRVAERGERVEDPVPLDHYDSDPDEAVPDADEPRLGSADFVVEPVGKRQDEMTKPQFEGVLLETYRLTRDAKIARERYPWRRRIFEAEASPTAGQSAAATELDLQD